MMEISDTRSTFASEDARPWSDEKKIACDRKYTAALMEFVNGRRYAAVIKRNLERLAAAKVPMEVRCLVVPGCTGDDDIVSRHQYLHALGLANRQIVDLEYNDYARSKYLALGMDDFMPPKQVSKAATR